MASSKIQVHQMHDWLEKNKDDFKPPVCNKCIFKGQLWSFFIGGPNERADFHVEEGEEFFCQVKGPMVLRVRERGCPRDVRIEEGEAFLLPPRVPHSPQRFEGTVGFVIERRRLPSEKDCLRYFVGPSEEVLYERWAHVSDIVADLPPIIRGYFASSAHATKVPGPDSLVPGAAAFAADREVTLMEPFHLRRRVEELASGSAPIQSLVCGFETQVELVLGSQEQTLNAYDGDTFLWQLAGESQIWLNAESAEFRENSLSCIATGKSDMLQLSGKGKDSRIMVIRMPMPNIVSK